MTRRLIILIAIVTIGTISCNAQDLDRKSMRDSLANAIEKLSFHTDSVDLILRKAAWNMQLEEWQYAKDEYDKVLRIDPVNPAALYYRAYANEKLCRYDFARNDYKKLLTIVPGNYNALLGYALLNEKDNHHTEALDIINQLISQHPDSAIAYAIRAEIELNNGMAEAAEFDIEEALRLSPDNTDFLYRKAEILILLRKNDSAKRTLDRIVALGIPRKTLKELYQKTKK